MKNVKLADIFSMKKEQKCTIVKSEMGYGSGIGPSVIVGWYKIFELPLNYKIDIF